ncbi:MAG: tRNA (cytidine(34)-2'-O)-methyltransferase [Magnetococcales bacterium]|nr:tRNA (cytidine(34)-2'-O)-methyltransferase [Magnetococcales bacterium]MBF0115097.1 tRNA (cytidine(34)-2'-O)-methyltransferase [Magnetococcales bacterium]
MRRFEEHRFEEQELSSTNNALHVILYQPEIPPNTGNIVRVCAASGSVLHLIGPLGFRLDGAAVRRAGMDYREWAEVKRWQDWPSYLAEHPPESRLFVVSTHAKTTYADRQFQPGDRFLFGSESAGLPQVIRTTYADTMIRIPMVARARSLNLANSVSIVLYEALRQLSFPAVS